ncbi:MAG: hypothetical protein KJO41_05540 [Bacteroidia bacterium]|nr:hypothetical protein [Bacteroidia bacterium]MBT8278445.1 hypothetical protein [Bacteroidia bacterium]NND25793.1 hypothetical protein [Flavobacteriaceae bacterium]NNK60322.1 hypothetical protein [Flavobacteriaceae bacterium]RZW46716.1 MAG: hypothetical protein EX263_09140 [Flavobacteriaceae bacterium]
MTNTNKPGVLFWIIGIVALLWNAMGVLNYLAQAYDMEMATEKLSAEQIAFMDALPAWNTALFAIAVFAGLAAALAFLMRKKLAVMLFIVSFVAAAISQVYWLFGTDAPEVFSDHQPYLMPAIIVILGLVFIWYSKKQKDAGVLN